MFRKTDTEKKSDNKTVKRGSYSALFTAIAVAAVIAVNLAASQLPGSVNGIDLTANDLYSIGSETEGVIGDLKDDVLITVLTTEKSTDSSLKQLLDRYDSSDKISIKYVDTSVNLSMSQKYEGLTAGSLVVSCGDRERQIDLSDIYVSDYSSDSETGANYFFDGEALITGAICYVTSKDMPKLYNVVGHGEVDLGSAVSDIIAKQNIELCELNMLASGSVPEDCSCLLINAPASDYTKEEADSIISYLDNGGKAVALLNYTEDDLTNFNSILSSYGITVNDGIAMESGSNYYQYPLYVIGTLVSSDITDVLMEKKDNILVPYSLAFTADEDTDADLTELLATSDDAYLKTVGADGSFETLEKESGDKQGRFVLAYLSEKKAGAADGDSDHSKKGELAAFSSAALIDDSVVKSFNLGNIDLFGQTLSYLCSDEDTNIVSIPSKKMSSEYVTVSAVHTIIWSIVTVIIIPLAIIIIGLIVWIRRKRK